MNTEDLQKTNQNNRLQREKDADSGFDSTAGTEIEKETAKLVPDDTEQAYALSINPKVLETPDENQGAETSTEGEISPADSTASASNFIYQDSPHTRSASPEIGNRNVRFDRKQLFNAIYFALCAVAFGYYIPFADALHLIPLWIALAILARLGLHFAFKPHSTFLRSSVYLSPRTSKLLRFGFMVLPIPFLLGGAMDFGARTENANGFRDYWESKYDSSIQHYKNAAMLAPGKAYAYIGLSDNYYQLDKYTEAITNADKAIALDPTKSYAWSDKARAQAALDPASADAINNAEKAISLDGENGQAYGTLAELYLNSVDLPKALAAANQHVILHSTEANALEVRAQILEKLGRPDEAAADRLAMQQRKN